MIEISPKDRVFVLTGAGVSAESGIPTFRGAGGLWRNYSFEEVASRNAWRRDPQMVWEFYSMRRRVASAAKPNPGHSALAELERCANAQFDGSIVELFVRTMRTLPNPIIEVAATTSSQRNS